MPENVMKHCWHPWWDKQHPNIRPTLIRCGTKLAEICCWCGKERTISYDCATTEVIQHHGPHVHEQQIRVYVKSPGPLLSHPLDAEECPNRTAGA